MLLQQFERFDEEWNRCPELVFSDYQICSFFLRIYYGSSLEKLTQAFSHLKKEKEDKSPDFTICLWDAAVKGKKLPPIDWDFLMKTSHYDSEEGPIYFHWLDSIEALSFIHMRKKRAYYVVRNGKNLPWWVEGCPLQAILHAWLQQEGLQLTHTAAIGNETGAILLTGKGGSGKSTTTLTSLTEGLNYIGEDHSILELKNTPTVWSIYHSAKWKPHTRTLFPQYEAHIVNPKQADLEKALVFYKELFPEQIRISLPIRGIVSLSIGREELPVLKPLDAPIGIQRLMMSTLQQLPFCGPRTIQFFKEIGQTVKHYHLFLGKNLQTNVQLLKTLLT